MSMNRETKRRLQRQGALSAEGEPVRAPRAAPAPRQKEARTSPRQFLHEVRAELRKVAWPTREETRTYSIIVLVTVVVAMFAIAGLDYLFGSAVLWMYDR
jgi:preprotein translocase subunit SecE